VTLRFTPNLALAKRIASDIGCEDVPDVYGAIQRRAPGVLFINAQFDELSRDQYEDLCFAIESELQSLRRRVAATALASPREAADT
jgi:hypothetical protein